MSEISYDRKLENYLETTNASDGTKEQYRRVFNRMKESDIGVKKDYTRDEAQAVLAYMKKYYCDSKNSYRTHYYIMRSIIVNVLGGDWKLTKQHVPKKPGSDEMDRPIYSVDEVLERINKIYLLSKRQKFLLAVSTIYGPRRIELCYLTKDQIQGNSIHIKTAKGGESRTHIIPDPVRDYIKSKYAFSTPMEESTLSKYFQQMDQDLGYNHKQNWDGYGYHAIRRRLATELNQSDELTREDIYKFMRWSRQKDILDDYTIMDVGEVKADLEKVDRKIFEVHPFLDAWKTYSS
jgi:integrase